MARIVYGKTWWGKQWLNALTDIDWSNRLPRGKTYANKGAVEKLDHSTTKITSTVEGSYHNWYKQKIELIPFTKKEKETLVQHLLENELVVVKLLSGQMSQSVEKVLESLEISLFPASWNDLSMHCNCPDMAVPCKHLAAVIYVLTQEVDKNPFLLFEWKGLDLKKELAKATGITSLSSDPIIDINLLLSDTANTTVTSTTENIDFSKITPLTTSLFSLLADAPLFCTANFKELLQKLYLKVKRNALKGSVTLERNEVLINKLKNTEELYLILDLQLQLWDCFSYEEESYISFFNGRKATASDVIELIEVLSDDELVEMPTFVRQLKEISIFCNQLMEKGAFVPRLLKNEEVYFIEWVPASFEKSVSDLIKQFTAAIELDKLIVKTNEGMRFLPAEEVVNNLCHLFIQHEIEKISAGFITPEEEISNLFFEGLPNSFQQVGKTEVPKNIQHWLKVFSITHKEFVPAIQLLEEEEHYFVRVVITTKENTEAPISLPVFWNDIAYSSYKYDVLQDLQIIAAQYPDLETHIFSKGKQPLMYDKEEIVTVLFEIFPVIELLGISLLMPKALKKLIQPSLSIRAAVEGVPDEGEKSFMGIQQLLVFDWDVVIGDLSISKEEFLAKYADLSGIVKVKNEYIHFDKAAILELLKEIDTPPKFKPHQMTQALFSEEIEGKSLTFTDELKDYIKELTLDRNVLLPAALKATLRPYQEKGFKWMYKNTKVGFGSLIADDMGLGKTLQVITLLLKLKEEGALEKKKALVIVPTSLLTNWQKEIIRFAPGLNASVFHGTNRKLEKEFDVLITTYGLARTEEKALKKIKWGVMVIDEAQNIKNPSAQQTKIIKSIKADTYIGMSGTPVENRLSEYWSVMDFVNKGYLGTLSNFTKTIAQPIQKSRDFEVLDYFKRITQPFILRRLKTDKSIISDLPDKIEKNQYINLSPAQTVIYKELVDSAMKEIAENDGKAKKGLVLKMMMGLKQICNHPQLFLKDPVLPAEDSTKVNRLFEVLDQVREKGEKVLIFTQYKLMGTLLQEWIEQRYGKKPLFLHGGNSRKERDKMVDQFQTMRTENIFLLSLKAAGTGLNLTQANHVVHFDLWWNPAVEAQATDRAYRIGQKKNVIVHRMLCKGTIEEKIDVMLQHKKELSDMSIAEGETWIGNLNDDQLREMVHLEG
ncbi:DEAD/DEAH box helicase [Flammeovirga pectinis]|uniref:DEAD/DEAH box helicase n=1 Tax=Flammeovirga pectinis TaxID=2494373 RepID=A0A3S9NXV6_9BACT|nr:DEAD/DEAH box helicase [Flammeovirga pectinis]AZQ60747.1 DEAD/DEAH box helicase [Flammeovirga pectinis]